jgi:hypothetical protein
LIPERAVPGPDRDPVAIDDDPSDDTLQRYDRIEADQQGVVESRNGSDVAVVAGSTAEPLGIDVRLQVREPGFPGSIRICASAAPAHAVAVTEMPAPSVKRLGPSV